MAIGAFGRNRNAEGESEAVQAPASPKARPAQLVTALIDQGSRCEGKLFFRDAVRIDGSFSGEISSENSLIVGETGEIEAEIRSARVIVSGSVVGDVHASAQIVLHKTARVEGDLTTPSLVVETGAVLKGRVDMGPAAKSESPAALKAISGGAAKVSEGVSKSAGSFAKAPAASAKGSGSAREGSKPTAS